MVEKGVGEYSNIRLVWRGKALLDTKTIQEIGLSDGDTVQIIKKQPETKQKEDPVTVQQQNVLSNSALQKIHTEEFWTEFLRWSKGEFELQDAELFAKEVRSCFSNKKSRSS